MPKQCKEPGCLNNVFGGGYCKFHQWRRGIKKIRLFGKQILKNMDSLIDKQKKLLSDYSLTGVYIRCQGKNFECPNHDVIEDFPDDAGEILFAKGWRVFEKDLVLCPDCAMLKTLKQHE